MRQRRRNDATTQEIAGTILLLIAFAVLFLYIFGAYGNALP